MLNIIYESSHYYRTFKKEEKRRYIHLKYRDECSAKPLYHYNWPELISIGKKEPRENLESRRLVIPAAVA